MNGEARKRFDEAMRRCPPIDLTDPTAMRKAIAEMEEMHKRDEAMKPKPISISMRVIRSAA